MGDIMRCKLVKARKEAGLTQKELAERIGIDRTSYTHIENGNRNPSLITAYKIALELEKRIDEIFLPNDVLDKHKAIKEIS